MTKKIPSMFSRLAAQFLKPTLALLAACIVGGAWAGYIDDTGTVTHETLDASLATTEGIWIGNNDWLIWESSQTSDGFKTNGLVATYLELAGWDGASAKLQINSGFYRANTGDLTVGGKDAQAYFTLNGGRVETAYWMVTSTGAWNADTSSHIGNGGVSTLVVNDGELVIGYRYNDATQQYELSNNGVIDLARASSNKSYFLQRGGIVSSQGVEDGNALVVANGASSEAVYTISNGTYTARANTKIVLGNGDGSKGTLNIHGGTVNAANVSKGSGAGSVSFDGGTLAATAAGTLIGSGLTVTIGSNGGTIDVGANNVTIAATVTGTGTITVKGTGSLTFTGDMSGFCGAVVVETSGCTVTLPASATKAVPGANTSASNGVYSYSANTTHHDWWTGDSSTDWATAGNWGRFLIDEGTTGYDINEWNDNTINFASVVNISKPLTITENDPDKSYNVEFTASSASDGLVSSDVLNVGTSNEGMATFTSGTYSFNNMYVGGSGATGSVTVNGASLTITTGDPQIGNGGTGTFTLSSGFVSFGYAGSAKWAFLKGGTINLDGGEMAVCRLNCDTAPAVINFNGGTLTSYNDGYSKDNIIENDANWTLNVKAGGAKFNIPSGLTTTVNQVLAGDAESTGGGLTKLGGGALVLLAEPTFTGVITVFGGSVKLPAGATVAAGENTVKYESADGVYFYPKYTWCGSANDGAWTNPANWLVGEVAAVGYPSAEGEVAVIATAATIYSDVAISVSEIQTDAAVTFAGKLTSSSLVKSGTGTLTLVGVTSPTTDFAITAGSVVINNSLDGITPYVQLDASNESTVTVTGDYVTKWTSSVAENDTTHYYENADSTMTLTTDYFGGKRAVRTNGSNLKADFSNKLGVRSVFAVLYGISYPDGMRLYYKTGANNVYIGKRNSGNNYWSCLIASKTTPASPYLWQNGALDDLWSTTAAGSVFTVKKFMNNSTSADYLGGTGDIAIGELIGLSAAEPSASDSKRIEAYLGNKWNISGMQTFATSIPLTLSAGTTLDLGSLSRTVASLTGSGTVQNGTLIVTTPISVATGDTLVIPSASTYTLAAGMIATVDADAGTATITKAPASITVSDVTTYYPTVQAAVDAAALAAAGEGKMINVLQNFNENIVISATGIVINMSTFTNAGSVTGVQGTTDVIWNDESKTWVSIENTPFQWTGAIDNNWTRDGNWNKSGYPGTADDVVFPASDEPWSVALGDDITVSTVAFNGNVVISGGVLFVTSAPTGSGTITLGENGGFGNNGTEFTLANNVIIAGGETTTKLYSKNARFTVSGGLSGEGRLELVAYNDQDGIILKGANTMTAGSITVNAALNGSHRNCSAVRPAATNARIAWTVSNGTASNNSSQFNWFNGSEQGTYYFGSVGNSSINQPGGLKNSILEIGALNSPNDMLSGWMVVSSVTDRHWNSTYTSTTVKKVGTGKLGVAMNSVYNYEIKGGSLELLVDNARPAPTGTIAFTGEGALALNDAFTYDVSTNIAAVTASTPYPITVDTGTTPRTWEVAIPNNYTGGFTKKGAGTLILSALPAYTGTTTVEGGVLYIVEGYSPTLAAGTVEMVSDKTGYKKYVPAAAAVAHVGNLYYPTFAEAWAAAGNGDNAARIYLDAAPAQDDVVTLTEAWQRVRVANGTYSADGHIAISGSLANVALKTSLGAEMTEYTAYPTVTVAVVPGAGVASGEIANASSYLEKNGSVYTIYSGSEVTITWTAAEGYEFAGGQSTATTVISPTENVTPQCPAATAVVVGSVSIAAPVVGAYGNDFATVSVTAGVTSTYPAATEITYTLKANGTEIATTTAAGDATSVTFDNANVSGLSRYGNISYTVEATGDNVTAATSDATTAMLADAKGWIDEKKSTTGTTGAWKTTDGAAATVTYDDETDRAELSDNKFSATNCSTGDVVTVTIKDVIYTALSDTSTVDGDAQGSIALGGTESEPKFMVLTKSGDTVQWSEAAGVVPSLNTSYTIVFTFDYNNNTYSITVNGTALTVGGLSTYGIVKTDNKYVKDIDFLGAGSIKAIEGIQYDAMMAVDQNGVRYATVAEALDANKSVKGAIIKLLHGTSNTNVAGWSYNAATMTFIKKAVGLIFLAL